SETQVTAHRRPEPTLTWHIRDARGRKLRPLDPIALHLLRRHDVIDAEVLRAIAQDPGLKIKGKERAAFAVGLLGALTVIGLFGTAVYTGDLVGAPLAKTAGLFWLCSIPWIIWYAVKRSRLGKIAAAMLKYQRCPGCGYDLRMLPAAPVDGATVCPECGCAWTLDTDPGARGRCDG
ncbi:MAG: hypothetical protein PVI86_01220, partial [Phycisphaerae bacterium]